MTFFDSDQFKLYPVAMFVCLCVCVSGDRCNGQEQKQQPRLMLLFCGVTSSSSFNQSALSKPLAPPTIFFWANLSAYPREGTWLVPGKSSSKWPFEEGSRSGDTH